MEIIYWGNRVERFIEDLGQNISMRIKDSINLLEEFGYQLDLPDSKSLGKGLFELRIQGKIKVRIIYTFHGGKAYIIHGFVKKTWKIPIRDISYSRKIQKEIIELV
jgi:phage-related protein